MTQAVENTEATLWEQYRDTYLNFITSMSQIRILTFVNEAVFEDFPLNLPDGLRHALLDAVGELPRVVQEMLEGGKEEGASLGLTDDETTSDLVFWTTLPFFAYLYSGAGPGLAERSLPFEPGFETLLRSQSLIMAFACLDAFKADILRAICKVVPEILRSKKKIEWKTALTFGSREELLLHLAERYVLEFNWLSVPKRLDFLCAEIGLDIPVTEAEVEFFGYAENVRHILVHNGGKVSQEFIERTGYRDLTVGEFVPVTKGWEYEVVVRVVVLGQCLFDAVSQKFFYDDYQGPKINWNIPPPDKPWK